jgi:IS5 family transposase
MHVLSDANGLPLLVGVSAGNTHDSEGLKPMIEGHQTRHDPCRGRNFKPQRLHADKAYDHASLRKWLRGKRIGVRIARKGIESSERLLISSGCCRVLIPAVGRSYAVHAGRRVDRRAATVS